MTSASSVTSRTSGSSHGVERPDRPPVQMLANSEAVILDMVGRDGQWQLGELYPECELFSKTNAFCDEHSLDLDVSIICELEGKPAGHYSLTTTQTKRSPRLHR